LLSLLTFAVGSASEKAAGLSDICFTDSRAGRSRAVAWLPNFASPGSAEGGVNDDFQVLEASLEVTATPGELGQRGTPATGVGSIACDVIGMAPV